MKPAWSKQLPPGAAGNMKKVRPAITNNVMWTLLRVCAGTGGQRLYRSSLAEEGLQAGSLKDIAVSWHHLHSPAGTLGIHMSHVNSNSKWQTRFHIDEWRRIKSPLLPTPGGREVDRKWQRSHHHLSLDQNKFQARDIGLKHGNRMCRWKSVGKYL